MSELTLSQKLEKIGLVAIIRSSEPVDLLAIAQSLADGGVRAMEITLNTPGALDSISKIRKELSSEFHVGAGTILNSGDAKCAIDVGAEFIVTPTLQLDSISLCQSMDIPIFCGCLTPTEALSAHSKGADFIKVFPAETFGPLYIKALRAPMPFLKLVPTGGVTLRNVSDWFDAGACAVAVGSSLVNADTIAKRDWDNLTEQASKFVDAVENARGSN